MEDINALWEIVHIFYKSTKIVVNILNFPIIFNGLNDHLVGGISQPFELKVVKFLEGLKYLGFYLKPNSYGKQDWGWPISKV